MPKDDDKHEMDIKLVKDVPALSPWNPADLPLLQAMFGVGYADCEEFTLPNGTRARKWTWRPHAPEEQEEDDDQ